MHSAEELHTCQQDRENVLLVEHLRVWFRLFNLVTIGSHMFGIIPTVVVLVILLPNVTVIMAVTIGMLMAV